MSAVNKYIEAVIYMEYVTSNAVRHHGYSEKAAREIEFHMTEKCLDLGIDMDMVLLHASASVAPILN